LDPEAEISLQQASFWGYLDQLVAACPLVIDRPRNSTHPRFPEIVYPLDYGYLEDSSAVDGGGVDVWLGNSGTHNLNAVILTVDLYKHDAEIKILLGCTESEMQTILDFQNAGSMRALLVRRTTNPGDEK
jgi:inorganic pyrophosphatase